MLHKNYELIAIFTCNGFTIDTISTNNKDFYFDKDFINNIQKNKYNTLFNFGFGLKSKNMHPSITFLHSISEKFIDNISKDSDIEITRTPKQIDDETAIEILHIVPYATGIEFINISWIKNIWKELCIAFEDEIAVFEGSVSDYLHSKKSNINVVGRVFFHLVENRDPEYPFAFLSTYSTGSKNNVSHLPLKNALIEYNKEQNKLIALLSTISKTTDKSDFISELVESGEIFSPLKFNVEEAYIFLKEVPLYEESGIVCRIPNWWKKKGSVKLSLSIGEKVPSVVGMDSLMSFNPSIYLGDIEISKEEIKQLISQTNGLSLLKGKWIEVDHDKLKAVLEAFNKAEKMGDLTFAEAMRMQLNLNNMLSVEEDVSVEIKNGEWLNSIKSRLTNPIKIENLSLGNDFLATLRHYQQTGFNWLRLMKTLNFGALLADDMGLGKTIQILALLEYLRQNGNSKVLLIIPASLICNWKNEIDKFTPKLKYNIIHTNNKNLDISNFDLFITTYGMATRIETFKSINWDLIILDEAQAIKNTNTKQTKAIKEIKSKSKIAITGTPIENRLSDLWSIFDFLNKGLLGNTQEFTNFIKGLKEDGTGYSRLREIVKPFILRRLKTDKSVITDLPDKIELKAFTTLTKKQVVLYNALVKDLKKALDDTTGIAKKGLVLASIMKFKQICNHPDQYLEQTEFNSLHSGKFQKLTEICETILEKRERVLIFTQFKEMVQPISNHLEKIFDRKGLILHGGTQVKKRGELVEKFNSEEYIPYMVLSLKAGGVGLNLTSANHVIHFDRWWNPATENQATDRAFRIGQQKNVIVHKFITTGTIEQKIDLIIDEKQNLSNDIIASSGENWISEMSNEELIKLFSLEA